MAGIIDRIYSKSPTFVQNLAVTGYGYYWMNRRFGGIFNREYEASKSREEFTAEEWRSYQTLMLRKMIVHAFETVPYYAESFRKKGISPNTLQSIEIETVGQLPLLEKEDLRKYGESRLLSTERERGGRFYSSSGTTGTPTKILYSTPMHQRWSAAYEARVRNWAGVSRQDPRGMIGGRRIIKEGMGKPPYFRYNYAEKQLYLSAYHISRQTAANYLEGIKKYGSQYMVGYAMSNFFLARFFDELKLDAPGMKAVITSSEKLTPAMRTVFERVYGCKSFDAWSGLEYCGLISESDHGQLLVSPDVGLIEILKEDGSPCKPGETGDVVCTGFLNFDQPLIRYRIGDRVTLSKDQRTRCGRNMTVIEEIVGRIEDVVIGRDGREMVRFHGIFIDLPSVAEAQVVQHEYDSFDINLVGIGQVSDADKEMILKRMKSQLGDVRILFNEVELIPRGPGGKFKAVISNVKRLS